MKMKIEWTKVLSIVLLCVSFSFFYLSSRIYWDYTSTFQEEINLDDFFYRHPYEFGDLFKCSLDSIFMQPNDYVTMYYEPLNSSRIYSAIYIILWYPVGECILTYSTSDFVCFKNEESQLILVYPHVALDKPNALSNNTLLVTVRLHHYEKPHWLCFSFGMIWSIVALIMVWKPQILFNRKKGELESSA